MQKDERDLLDVLKAELAFLEGGHYRRSPNEPWRQPLIFEDSPICINYDCKDQSEPCSSCILFQVVPPEFRDTETPCRHIPFTADGDTLDSIWLDSLRKYAPKVDLEDVYGHWLMATIAALEKQRRTPRFEVNRSSAPSGVRVIGEPLFQKQDPKCANPACATPFRWLDGGRFFRFRAEPAASHSNGNGAPSPLAIHGVKHYWLCENCSQIFTLAFEKNQGVVLNRRPEFMYHAE